MSRENALSAAAEDGCIKSTDWQAFDQHGRSWECCFHHSVLETVEETSSALAKYVASSLFKPFITAVKRYDL